ncbi:MAG: MaoC family dehydratase [Ramlibacter sp.]
MTKSRTGNFFEDFRIGQRMAHPTPRTITDGDRSLYIALTGSRDALSSAETVSLQAGLHRQPHDAFLVFNIAFGKTVPDVSLNAVANLGYAEGRFLAPVFSGDTLQVESEVIGLRETSGGRTGIVYTRSTALNQDERPVLTWIRWVLVHKRTPSAPPADPLTPQLAAAVAPTALVLPDYGPDVANIALATGSNDYWDDYEAGERIDHPSGMTINDSDHSSATRLYQNTAKVHFDARMMAATLAGKRLVYGGHIISVARSLAHDGLENILGVLALNGGSHVAPTYAGDTVCCATTVLEPIELGHPRVGALRLRTVAATNIGSAKEIVFPPKGTGHATGAGVVLDIDYVVAIPKNPRTQESA